MSTKEEKGKALSLALATIEKAHGKEAIMKLGEKTGRVHVDVIPTGALPLDVALGIGGLPRGRVVEVYGPESSGKTTLCLQVVAQAQKLGGTAAYIDAEHAMDPDYAKKLGVDVENLLISQPDSGEQALEITDQLVRSGALDIVVVDSVAALVPRAEIEGEMGDSHVGLQARLMSQALRKLTANIARSKTCVIFINQLRMKIGVMYGNPETTTGGMALKFYASVRLDIRRVESIKMGDKVVGNRVRIKVVKNKLAAPFQQAECDMIFGEGIARENCLLDLGVSTGVLEKAGTWILYKTDRLGQGREQARIFLKENLPFADQLELAIRAKVLGGRVAESPSESKPALKEKETAKSAKAVKA
jgi:recombination protein RecA